MTTIDRQIAEVERELDERRKIYRQWVRLGTLKQEEADYQIADLEAALNTLKHVRDDRDREDDEEPEMWSR